MTGSHRHQSDLGYKMSAPWRVFVDGKERTPPRRGWCLQWAHNLLVVVFSVIIFMLTCDLLLTLKNALNVLVISSEQTGSGTVQNVTSPIMFPATTRLVNFLWYNIHTFGVL